MLINSSRLHGELKTQHNGLLRSTDAMVKLKLSANQYQEAAAELERLGYAKVRPGWLELNRHPDADKETE